MNWQPWQERIIRTIHRTPTTLVSLPRGNGKSTLAANLAADCLTPGTRWHHPDAETIIVSGSIAQARRTIWGLLRPLLREIDRVRVNDTAQDLGAVNVETGARVSVMASNSARALGIVGAPLVIGDEPASWVPRDRTCTTPWRPRLASRDRKPICYS